MKTCHNFKHEIINKGFNIYMEHTSDLCRRLQESHISIHTVKLEKTKYYTKHYQPTQVVQSSINFCSSHIAT